MRKNRNRLLITLVLFGVLFAAAANAQTVRSQRYGSVDLIRSVYKPGATPNAGEPDIGASTPNRVSMRSTSRSDVPSAGTTQLRVTTSISQTLRWAWVIWMARYLNLAP